MKINTKIIKKLKPCENRLDNYLKYYKDFDGTLEDFILLENITYNDKVWVVTRLFTKEQNVKWSILCASKILSIFEQKYPNDNRPRKALEAAEKWLLNPTEENMRVASYSAHAAAAYAVSASAAAYAAAYVVSAANTASAATYVAYTACDAAYSAAYAAASYSAAYVEKIIEREVNLILMLECV